jgi:hypothetical protein
MAVREEELSHCDVPFADGGVLEAGGSQDGSRMTLGREKLGAR